MQLLREVPFFEWKNADPFEKVVLPFSPGTCFSCYHTDDNRDTGIFSFENDFHNDSNTLLIAWRSEYQSLIIQEHWEFGTHSNKLVIELPCNIAKGGVYIYKKEDQFVLNIITQDNYLYYIPSAISKSNKSLELDIASVTRQLLDGEEFNEVSGHISKIVWNETFVCRLVDSKYVLFTELYESPKTIRLYNNQYSLTRALQTFLNTFSNILDIEYYNNELWFLYDSYEIQRYNLCTMKWSGDYQISIPSSSPLPRRMSKGFLRLANDRALVGYQDRKQVFTFYFFQLPSFTFLQEVALPCSFTLLHERNPYFSHPLAVHPAVELTSVLLTYHSIIDSYLFYAVWSKDGYSWLSCCSTDALTQSVSHSFSISLLDDIHCFYQHADYYDHFERCTEDLTEEVRHSIDSYYTCLLTHQSYFSTELLYDLIHAPTSDSIEQQLIHTVDTNYYTTLTEQRREGIGSNQSACDLYNRCWLDFIRQIHSLYSTVFSITLSNQSVLLTRWYSFSVLQNADIIEQMEFADCGEQSQTKVLENANMLYNALYQHSIFVENILDYWNDENQVLSEVDLKAIPWHPLSDSALYTGFQSILSVFEIPRVSTSVSESSQTSSPFSTSLFLSQYDRRCYAVYHRCLPLFYYLQYLVPHHPELATSLQQITRLVLTSYCYLRIHRIQIKHGQSISGILQEFYQAYEQKHRDDHSKMDAIVWRLCMDQMILTLRSSEFAAFLLEKEYYTVLFEYLYPLIANLSQLAVTDEETLGVQANKRILIQACFRSNQPDFIHKIDFLLEQFKQDPEDLLFILRTLYETRHDVLAIEYGEVALQTFPEHAQLVYHILFKLYVEKQDLSQAIATLLQMSHENAVLHLPAFISDLSRTQRIGNLSAYNFNDLTPDLHQVLLTECNYHPVDSPVFAAAHLLLKNAGDIRLSLVPLAILLEKCSLAPLTEAILLRQKRTIGLILTVLLTLPPAQQSIETPEHPLTIVDLRQKLVFVEGQLCVYQREGCLVQDLNTLLHKLLLHQEVQLVIQIYEVFDLHNTLLFSYLSQEWNKQQKEGDIQTWLYTCCVDLLQKDGNGRYIAHFMEGLLEEDPCVVVPPFILEIIKNHGKEGCSSYVLLFDVLMKHQVLDEACRLMITILQVVVETQTTTWISENCLDRLLSAIETVNQHSEIELSYKELLNGWKRTILELMKKRSVKLCVCYKTCTN